LGKILIDLRNTREEAINVAGLKNNYEHYTRSSKKEDANAPSIAHTKNEGVKESSLTADLAIDQDDDDEKETEYRLDPK